VWIDGGSTKYPVVCCHGMRPTSTTVVHQRWRHAPPAIVSYRVVDRRCRVTQPRSQSACPLTRPALVTSPWFGAANVNSRHVPSHHVRRTCAVDECGSIVPSPSCWRVCCDVWRLWTGAVVVRSIRAVCRRSVRRSPEVTSAHRARHVHTSVTVMADGGNDGSENGATPS
jgi:hypothetical protein